MESEEIIVGTDCSGIGAPEQALTELQNEGILSYKSEFACDIDKYARKSYQAIHGNHKMYEDITTRDHKEVPQLGLYVAGFPCQAFSIAGKGKGFDDVRGTIFFNVAEFIKINQPKVFILENVKGLTSHDSGKTFQTIISILSNGGGTVNGQTMIPFYDDGLGYHIYYQVLDTKKHGIPQSRERIFIVGFKDYKTYRFPIDEPLRLKLKDILQKDVGKKYNISEKRLKGFVCGKSDFKERFDIRDVEKYAGCIDTKEGSRRTNNFLKINEDDDYEVLIGAIRGRNPDNPKSRKVGLETKQMLEINKNGTSNCLTSVQKDNIVITDKIRRLTPLECWRLQGFPDEAFYKAQSVNSDSQLYKQAGNSITVRVIKKIIYNIYS